MNELYMMITGSRTWTDGAFIYSKMYETAFPKNMPSYDRIHVIVGCARGADAIARAWVHEIADSGTEIFLHHFQADWKNEGRAAGPKRNQKMVDFVKYNADYYDTVTCLAFQRQNSRGTADMIQRVKRAGFTGRRFTA